MTFSTLEEVKQKIAEAASLESLISAIKGAFAKAFVGDPGNYKNDGTDYGLKVRGKKAREKINAQCKAILDRVKGDPSLLTEEDRALLLQYSGRGGTDDNSQFEYYTPTYVAEGVWQAMQANGYVNGNVLEPSCGAGVFLGTKPSGTIMTANDLDPLGSGVAGLLNPSDSVSTQPFESVVMSTDDNTFDSCVGNVPFGNARGKSMHLDPAYKNEKSIERYFILRILDKIKPGGLACLVCPINIVGNKGTKWEEFRRAVSRKAEFLGAHKLPSKTFSAQGTDTVVDVVVFRKHNSDLLHRLQEDEIPTETLEQANVYWTEFITGKYWQGEGKPFIMGKYTPKVAGDRWSRETVEGNVSNEELKRKLAQKFSSRINWELLDLAETITRNYTDGDQRYINGDPYEMRGGVWEKVQVVQKVDTDQPDVSEFGVSSLDELRALLADSEGGLSLTFEQAKKVNDLYPHFLTQQVRDAVAAADAQNNPPLKEQMYRGSIIGAMIAKMGVDEEGGEDVSTRRLTLQNIVTREIERFGLPCNSAKLSILGEKSRAYGVFLNSVDRDGKFSALLSGTLDKSAAKGYRSDSVHSIIDYLLERENYPEVEIKDVEPMYDGKLPLTLEDVAQLDNVAITPEGTLETMEKYCSGNIGKKIADMMTAIGNEQNEAIKAKYSKQLDLLKGKLQIVPIDEISFSLRNKWLEPKYVVEFLREYGYPNASYMVEKDVEEVDSDGTTRTQRKLVEDLNATNGQFYLEPNKTKMPKEFNGQFQKYLNGEKITSSDKKRIEAYKRDTEEFEGLFNSYMKTRADADEISYTYSLKFNAFSPMEYSEGPLDIGDYLSGEIIPHTYQNAEVRRLSDLGCGICGFGTGLGKAQPLDAKILTPTGWKTMGEMVVGQKIISVDGKAATVVGVFPQGKKEIFKVTFSDGSSTECCKEHLWTTQTLYERRNESGAKAYKPGTQWNCAKPKVRTLEEIMASIVDKSGAKNHSIPIVAPVEFEEQDVPLSPYALGCLLGDGGLTTKSLTFTNGDAEIYNILCKELPRTVSLVLRADRGKAKVYGIVGDGKNNDVLNAIRDLGLLGHKSTEKFIPDVYKFNSVQVRLLLLQGIMDTDGYVSKTGVTTQFSTSSTRLCGDVVFIVQSLGGIATVKSKIPMFTDKDGVKKQGHESYTVNIRFPSELSAFRFSGKKDRVLPKTKYVPVRYIVAVESVGEKLAQCIKIDHESELYVTDDFIVTHNTTTCLALAAYNHKHGKSNRTCIVVPSSVLENWYHEARTMYSESYMKSRVHFVGLEPKRDKDGNYVRKPILDENGQQKTKKDGSPLMQDEIVFTNSKEQVYESMWKIPQSNFSLVVMTKEKFKTIPIKPSTLDAYTNSMIERSLMNEKEVDKVKKSYADDVHITKLQEKFSDEATTKKNELPYLEDMGFDSIITDESHFFKNTLNPSEDARHITYVPMPNASQIARDMDIKSHYIRSKMGGRGMYGLTATPVTNSPIEVFNMLNMVAPPEEFMERGLFTPQNFIEQFGKIEEITRLDVSQDSVEGDALTGFRNLNGLRAFFTKYCNIKTIDDVSDVIHVPNANKIDEEVEMTSEQSETYEKLKREAKAIAAGEGDSSIFSVIRRMDRCTTDMDLYNHTMTFVLPIKYKNTISNSLSQITKPSGNSKKKITEEEGYDPTIETNDSETFKVIIHEAQEERFLSLLRSLRIPTEETNHPISPKYAKLIENAKKHLERNGKQIVFTEEKTQHGKISRILVHNLPIENSQIAVINAEDASGDKLDKISKAYNAGEVKIVVANKKAEVGVNLQKGTTAIHHLTLPWTPASINQRNGRGVRQGNKVESVDIYYYLGKGTFDLYRKQLLEAKSNWINELLLGTGNTAENADAAADEEMIALVSGNLEEYRRKKAQAEAEKKNRAGQQYINRLGQISHLSRLEKTHEERLQIAINDNKKNVADQEGRVYRLEHAKNPDPEKIEKAKAKLEQMRLVGEKISKRFADEKASRETQLKTLKNLLRQAASEGKLPFDPSLIDNPEDYIVSPMGKLICKGDTVQELEDGKPLNSFYIVVGFKEFLDGMKVKLESVSSGNSEYNLVRTFFVNFQQVTLSQAEIAYQKLVAGSLEYVELVKGDIAKDLFVENRESFKRFPGYFIVEKPDNSFKISLRKTEEGYKVVWPEPQNQDYRKKVIKAYVEYMRFNKYDTNVRPFLNSLLGEVTDEEIRGQQTTMSRTDMIALIADAFKELYDKSFNMFLERANELEKENSSDIAANAISHAFVYMESKVEYLFRKGGYDNLSELKDELAIFKAAKKQEEERLREQWHAYLEQKEAKKREALKANPNYKELTKEASEKFKALGLVAFYNEEEIVLAFRSKRTTHAPFSRLFVRDTFGYGGCLYHAKETLKSRYDAKYTKSIPGVPGESFWHVDADTDVEALIDIIAQYKKG